MASPFSLSLSSSSSSSSSAPSFSFGAASSPASPSPSFGFSAASSAPSTGFGSSFSTSPSLGFGSSGTPSSAAPNLFKCSSIFSPFGAPTSITTTTSSLLRGQTSTTTTPITTTPVTPSPSTGFSFTPQPSSAPLTSRFSFSIVASSTTTPTTTTVAATITTPASPLLGATSAVASSRLFSTPTATSTPSLADSSTSSAATYTAPPAFIGFSLTSATATTPPAASSFTGFRVCTGSTSSSTNSSFLSFSLPTTKTTTPALSSQSQPQPTTTTTTASATTGTAAAKTTIASTSAATVFARNLPKKKMSKRMSASAIRAIRAERLKKSMAARTPKVPTPDEDPKNAKKSNRPSLKIVDNDLEENPFASPKKDKGKNDGDSQIKDPVEQAFGPPPSPEANESVVEPRSRRGPPAGSSQPFVSLSKGDKMKRINRALAELYSAEDERYLESLGPQQIDELYETWVDLSIRMHAMLKGLCSAPSVELNRLKKQVFDMTEALERSDAENGKLRKELRDMGVKLEVAQNDSRQARINLQTFERNAKEYQEQRDSASRQLQKVKEDYYTIEAELNESKHKRKQLQQELDAAERSFLKQKDSVINEWLESEYGQRYKEQVAAEGSEVVEEDTLARARKAVEAVDASLWAAVEKQYKAIQAEEDARLLEDLNVRIDMDIPSGENVNVK